MVRKIVVVLSFSLLLSVNALAQSSGHLREYFEGKNVVVKIKMPATKEGVNLRVDRPPHIDFKKYNKKLGRYGISIHEGQVIQVTQVKVKKKHIEFQLGGGGYGSQYVARKTYPPTPKSEQEAHLEEELLTMGDAYPEVRRAAEERLDELVHERQQEDARLADLAAEENAAAKRRVRQRALAAGSRFNVRFKKRVPAEMLTPEGFMAALAEYVEFSPDAVEEALQRQEAERAENSNSEGADYEEPGPPADAKAVAELRKGLLWTEVVDLLGRPSNHEEWTEGSLKLTAGTFGSELGNVEAEFVEEVLIRYTLKSR